MELFLDYVQPAYRQLCHPDNGRVPLIPIHALQRYLNDKSMHFQDVQRLLDIFQHFVDDEDIQDTLSAPINQIDTQGAIVECNFCGLVIWNRHLHCEECQDFDICLTCFVNGRSCKHTSRYTWSEVLPRSLYNCIINDVKVQLHLQPDEIRKRTTVQMTASSEERYGSTTGSRV
jgi:Zinc finger, ZZ type